MMIQEDYMQTKDNFNTFIESKIESSVTTQVKKDSDNAGLVGVKVN